jgi:hypothetical protein
MRVTRESLIRIAKETTQERAYNDHTIVAAYLTGSLISSEDPMIGGTADIDLVLVHNSQPGFTRQVARLTPDFHIDIHHRTRFDFKSPRELRTDPFLGWELYDPMLLFEREKFFEFYQAGLRAGFEFHSPVFVMGRCRNLHASARRAWVDLMDVNGEKAGVKELRRFLSALSDAANSIAELTGGPLAERRFLTDFPARAQAAERPEFAATLFNLLGAGRTDPGTVTEWLKTWRSAFLAAAEKNNVDGRIHPARLNYYEKAIRSYLITETPLAALWPLITTWTLASSALGDQIGPSWADACRTLGILGQSLEERVAGLDKFLDEIEVHLDEIAAANGLETSTSI